MPAAAGIKPSWVLWRVTPASAVLVTLAVWFMKCVAGKMCGEGTDFLRAERTQTYRGYYFHEYMMQARALLPFAGATAQGRSVVVQHHARIPRTGVSLRRRRLTLLQAKQDDERRSEMPPATPSGEHDAVIGCCRPGASDMQTQSLRAMQAQSLSAMMDTQTEEDLF